MKPNLSPKRSEIAWTNPMAQSQDAEDSESAGDGGISAIYPLLPLRQTLVFPKLVAPMAVSREDSLAAIDVAMAEDQVLVAVAQRDPPDDEPAPALVAEQLAAVKGKR